MAIYAVPKLTAPGPYRFCLICCSINEWNNFEGPCRDLVSLIYNINNANQSKIPYVHDWTVA